METDQHQAFRNDQGLPWSMRFIWEWQLKYEQWSSEPWDSWLPTAGTTPFIAMFDRWCLTIASVSTVKHHTFLRAIEHQRFLTVIKHQPKHIYSSISTYIYIYIYKFIYSFLMIDLFTHIYICFYIRIHTYFTQLLYLQKVGPRSTDSGDPHCSVGGPCPGAPGAPASCEAAANFLPFIWSASGPMECRRMVWMTLF